MDRLMHTSQQREPPRGGAVRWIFWGFAAVGAYFLVTEHRQHLFEYLPYVLLLACPLLHLFHGHRHHQHDKPNTGNNPTSAAEI